LVTSTPKGNVWFYNPFFQSAPPAFWIANFALRLLGVYLLVILTHGALSALQHDRLSLARSAGWAMSKMGPIATFGTLLSLGQSAGDMAHSVLPSSWHQWPITFAQYAWSFSLYLAFPVLSREQQSGLAAARRAWELIRRCWWQRLVGVAWLLLCSMAIVMAVTVLVAIASITSSILWSFPFPGHTSIFVSLLLLSAFAPSIFCITADQFFDCALYLAATPNQDAPSPVIPQPQTA
jgi:hypothetical protein